MSEPQRDQTPQRDPLDLTRLAAGVPGSVPGTTVEVVETAPSTNALARERAVAGAPDGLVVVAEHQTAGRGRLDRTWESPARSSLTFSVLLRPTAPTRSWPWLPLLSGYAVTKALRAHGFEAGVKWPNDVLLADQKVAGILVERVDTPQGAAAVIGIGLNVSLRVDELPVPTATSLALQGDVPDRTTLLLGLLATLREGFDTWQVGGDLAGVRLLESYTAACLTLGRDVRVDLPSGETLVGRATDIDPSGRLLVQGPNGIEAVGAGDVVHVRPA